MSLNEKIIGLVKPIVGICKPDSYTGDAEIYSTFQYTEMPEGAGDDLPAALRCAVQLHLYLPPRTNSIGLRRQLRKVIAASEWFTAPSVTNASDLNGQHFVFEFDALEGW